MQKAWLFVIGGVVLVMVVLGWWSLNNPFPAASELHGTPLMTPVDVTRITYENPITDELSDISLTHSDLGDVTFQMWQGKYVLVFFGFSSCPDVCPITLQVLGNIYQDLAEPESLQVVMITVDPKKDTPEIAQRYASGFHPSFIGLGGDNQSIASTAKAFYAFYKDVRDQDPKQQVIHAETVFLVSPEGKLIRIYNSENVRLHLLSDLEKLL